MSQGLDVKTLTVEQLAKALVDMENEAANRP